MTLPRVEETRRRPMLVLSVRVTNRSERSILCVSSATFSLLPPMHTSERTREREGGKGDREANKYFYSISGSHTRILALSRRFLPLSLSDAFWERANVDFAQLYNWLFPPASALAALVFSPFNSNYFVYKARPVSFIPFHRSRELRFFRTQVK